ncbi:MAG: hypothetical protein EBU92_12855, partial [Betaproteobacteria bacterium]|nr:hypothetical protein [Betaproteobacteria bacterium]
MQKIDSFSFALHRTATALYSAPIVLAAAVVVFVADCPAESLAREVAADAAYRATIVQFRCVCNLILPSDQTTNFV